MIQLAFYLGTKRENPTHARWLDRLVCWWTGSRFSHVEFVEAWPTAGVATCWSASHRDGKVRAARIEIHNGRWLVVHVPHWNYHQVLAHYRARRGTSYGWLCAAAHALPQPLRGLMRWAGKQLPYCSSIAAEACGVPNPWITPQELYQLATGKAPA